MNNSQRPPLHRLSCWHTTPVVVGSRNVLIEQFPVKGEETTIPRQRGRNNNFSMASYREHLTVSFLLGCGVGAGATLGLGFSPVQGTIAGLLTGLGGMLPDLDSESGKPVREISSLTAALAPMAMMRRLEKWSSGDWESALLLAVCLYVAIRYGGAWILGKLSVHRGMFHSIPAALIAWELGYLGYEHSDWRVRALMGSGLGLGYLSHLLLDELYAVEWRGTRIRLNQFAGSALKLSSNNWAATTFAWGILFTMSYGLLADGNLPITFDRKPAKSPAKNPALLELEQQTAEPDPPHRRR